MRTREMGYYHPTFWTVGDAMERLTAHGIDPLKETIDYAHEIGVKILATNRPAAPHMAPYQEDMQSPWYMENTQWRCRIEDGGALQQMSFAYPEVAGKFLGIFREGLERGADGICMMWCRGWPWIMYDEPVVKSFVEKYGEDPRRLPRNDPRWMQHKADVMTDHFVRPMRKILDEFGQAQGRRLEAAYYVMDRPEDCLYNTLDVRTWVREGLVDYLMIHPNGWSEGASGKRDNLRVHEVVPLYKALVKGTHIQVYADVYPRRMPAEGYLERARFYYGTGVDGLMYWDVDCRTSRKSEWFTGAKMGHRDLIDTWPIDVSPHFKVVPLRMIGGLSTDPRYDTTG